MEGITMRAFTVIALAALALPSAPAAAQSASDVVVMRRSVAPPRVKAVASAPLTPGAKRRCDMPPDQTQPTGFKSLVSLGAVSSVTAGHALCETATSNFDVCYVYQYGNKTDGTYLVRGFTGGSVIPLGYSSDLFTGAAMCRSL